MGLITKPPSWGHCTSNLTGTPSSNLGTNFTCNANDADGTSVAVLTNISHDVEFLVISFAGINVAGGNSSALIDILVDPAGGSSWASAPLINDLLAGQSVASISNIVPMPVHYFFPIWLKSGHSIGVRGRTAHTVNLSSGRTVIHAFGGNANPASWWCGTTVETIGVDDTISQGTSHTAGNSGSFSSWANFGSTLSKPCGALQFGVHGTNIDTTQTVINYHFEFGVGSTRIGPPIWRGTSSIEVGFSTPTGPIFCALPSATQLQVRGTCSGTAEVIDVAAYAVM